MVFLNYEELLIEADAEGLIVEGSYKIISDSKQTGGIKCYIHL